MGRKTFESIGKPLPGRRNLVVTRTGNFAGVELVRELKAFDPAPTKRMGKKFSSLEEQRFTELLLTRCETIYVTIVKEEFTGDTYFPEFESSSKSQKRFGKLRNTNFQLPTASWCIGVTPDRH